jgi:hypothetical protein
MISNRSSQRLSKNVQLYETFSGENCIKRKCYFTVTSVFIKRHGRPCFAGYAHGCLRPYFHAGFFPNYDDLENKKKEKILAEEKRY